MFRIKKTIVCKDIHEYQVNEALVTTYTPVAGDVALFEVGEIGRHRNIQADDKRSVPIMPGDLIIAAFADRYATSQFEGYVPTEPMSTVHILSAGGAIGIVRTKNSSLDDVEPTNVHLVGYLTDPNGKIINTKFRETPRIAFRGELPNNAKVMLSIGSTMDSGKTTTAAHLARGLKYTGKTVAFIKLTGTCFTKDKDYVYDLGADISIDFSDAGFASTYMSSETEILDLYQTLLDKLAPYQPEYIVMEIADGLMQRETEFLLNNKAFMKTVYNVVFSCGDSLAALQGLKMLDEMGIEPAAISGRFTMSPLLIQEVHSRSGIPTYTIDQLMTGECNDTFIHESVLHKQLV